MYVNNLENCDKLHTLRKNRRPSYIIIIYYNILSINIIYLIYLFISIIY